jgi:hypothetical protein
VALVLSVAGCAWWKPDEGERQFKADLLGCRVNCVKARGKIGKVEAQLQKLEERPEGEAKKQDEKTE